MDKERSSSEKDVLCFATSVAYPNLIKTGPHGPWERRDERFSPCRVTRQCGPGRRVVEANFRNSLHVNVVNSLAEAKVVLRAGPLRLSD